MCQPASRRWRPNREIAWHSERYPRDPSQHSNSKRSPSSNAKIHCHLCLKIKKARVKINHIPCGELNFVSQMTRQKRLRERLNWTLMKWRKSIFSHSFALESPRVRPCPHESVYFWSRNFKWTRRYGAYTSASWLWFWLIWPKSNMRLLAVNNKSNKTNSEKIILYFS